MTSEIVRNSKQKDYLIYQVWSGNLRPGCKRSSKLLKQYAERIGADYRLDIDPNIAGSVCDVPMYFEWLNPMLDDSFTEYGTVCVLDMDIFPIKNLEENIFDQMDDHHDFGVCDEPFQGRYRASTTIGGHINSANDEKWASLVAAEYGVEMPRDAEGYVKVYNAGNVVFSNKGMQLIRDQFVPFQDYINYMRSNKMGRFYTVDQNYFHAMMFANETMIDGKSTICQMDRGWNDYVHEVRGPLGITTPIHDPRDASTKFVHVQLSGGDMFDDDKLDRITNLPQGQWKL